MRRTPRGRRAREDRTVPQVVAHRGSSHDTAEHTLAAYVRALDVGAEGLECDVRLTADGHLVCVHDRDLRRTASTAGLVSTMNLAELDELDFSSWKSPWSGLDDEAPDRDPDDGKVLTLRKLLETVADYDRHVDLAIETKHPTRFGGLVERRLVETLGDFGWDGPGSPARVMSFSLNAVTRVRRLAPDLEVVLLVDKAHHWPVLRPVAGADWVIGPGVQELRDHPGLGRHLVKEGREIHVWTVNTADELQVCLDLGVTAVISDRPAYMLELLGG
ncbi:glycerophosphodiester phosphodiesterase family protein [Nocardioides sp. S-58]|uniref:Glycerophosphodiester phosphodiesterase family protein n=1 Tax=Nocardioides renjunii TaxID=3095075 RepID=A0ABU5KA97_9ACTN|nr:glycerophosphodiester phosphodiesterase family protein [Nocardioides sp. S-58]MDZ5661490.1 glycerophosphodiester phosphodiesterase family protein [Nocardioides sp. S-58]